VEANNKMVVRATGESRAARVAAARAVASPRPVVRELGRGARPFELTFESRTAWDFMISLAVGDGAESDLLPEDRAWLTRSREQLGATALADVDTCFAGEMHGSLHGIASVLVDSPEVRTASQLVTMLNATGPRGIARAFVRDSVSGSPSPELVERVLDGDPAALAEVGPQLQEVQQDEIREFVVGAETEVNRLSRALEAWLPLFEPIEKRVGRYQERDLASRSTQRATLDPAALIEHVTGGLRYLPESNVRRVILAASYFARPYNYIYQGAGWRMFAYPISDAILESADDFTPLPSMVRLYRALGDPTRMRILKLLSDRDWYLTELATQLELSKPTMKHHLALMRAAGLVTVTEEGSLTYYSLRRDRLEEAGIELRRYIG
jgi:DNA-binding transcriptional ArsR family regulator